jgi:hypothetical protein
VFRVFRGFPSGGFPSDFRAFALPNGSLSAPISLTMANSFAVSRAQLIYALCLPLAVLMGYLLADPQDFTSIVMVSLVLGAMTIPAFMKWYHPWMVFSVNAVMFFMFLPGAPPLWMMMGVIGIIVAILNRFTSQEAKFVNVPSLTLPLLFLLAVIFVTAVCRGGLGLRVLGSSQYGGRYYIFASIGILGYFVLTSRRIPANRAGLYAGIFFLSGLTGIVPTLAGKLGANFLSYFFPQDSPGFDSPMFIDTGINRPGGLTYVFTALLCWVLARYGIRGLLDMTKPWRLGLFLLSIVAGLYGGFRSAVLLFLFTLAFQFFFEGLCRLRNLAIVVGILLVVGLALVPNVQKLPFAVQRSLSFLPLQVDPIVRMDADGSSDWRWRMWQDVLPTLPKYLLLGKGYGFDPDEQFQNLAHLNSFEENYSGSMLAGDYHNGPLSILVSFGLAGLAGFIWFVLASLKYLYRAMRNGDPQLRSINILLLAFFAARVAQFCLVFGMFPIDIATMAGLVGLSVSLNGHELVEPVKEEAEAETTGFEQELASTEIA